MRFSFVTGTSCHEMLLCRFAELSWKESLSFREMENHSVRNMPRLRKYSQPHLIGWLTNLLGLVVNYINCPGSDRLAMMATIVATFCTLAKCLAVIDRHTTLLLFHLLLAYNSGCIFVIFEYIYIITSIIGWVGNSLHTF